MEKSNKTLIIILIAVAVMMMCCCCIALGLAWNYGDAFVNAINAFAPFTLIA